MLKVVSLLFLVASIAAVPKFHDINDFDLQGNQCKGPNNFAVTCPTLCVKELALCPTGYSTCPTAGETLCADGHCAETCEDAGLNPCACSGKIPRPKEDPYVACRIINTKMDDFFKYKIEGFCNDLYNVSKVGDLSSGMNGAAGPLALSCGNSSFKLTLPYNLTYLLITPFLASLIM
jgi:hypothetical protein